jgi:hypothetical protein
MADTSTGRFSAARSNGAHFSGTSSNDMILSAASKLFLGTRSNSSNNPTMLITSNVGIGTAFPDAKLHVGGNTAIDDELRVMQFATMAGLRVSRYTSGAYSSNVPATNFAPSNVTNSRLNDNSNKAGYASNTATWTSNNAAPLAQLVSVSNYVYTSINNINAFPSASYLSLAAASNAYVLSNAQSNFVTYTTGNAMYAPSNTLSNYMLTSSLNATYAASNALSNYVLSNIAYAAFAPSNNQSYYLLSTTAQQLYARSNSLSNYVTFTAGDQRYGPSNSTSIALIKSTWTSNQLTTGPLNNSLTLFSTNASLTLSNSSAGTARIGLSSSNGAFSSDATSNDVVIANLNTTGKILLQRGTAASAIAVGSNNYVGIGIATPLYPLHVPGVIYSGNTVISQSDSNFKRDIQRIDSALAKVRQLGGYTFKQQGSEVDSTGVLAQEVERVLPQAVYTDATGRKSVAYGNLVGILIEAIKELADKLDRPN